MMGGMKALLGACMFVIAGLVAISTFSPAPTTSSKALHSIVSQTHQQLNQLHKLKEEFEGDQPLDSSILTELGFTENPVVYPDHSWNNISSPVLVSAISSLEFSLLGNLLKTCHLLASSNSSIVIYVLDLSPEETKQLESECNDTCDVIIFDFSRYPSHFRDLKLGAFRPIIIQEMLQRSGAVIWVDPCIQLIEATLPPVAGSSHFVSKEWTQKALRNSGVLTWLLSYPAPHLPTAALTHPDMFRSMGTSKKNYDFQKMSDPKLIYIINLPTIHQHLMRPWVRCALTPSCLSPIGAQETGCKYDKKPRFRYSGCHLYDSSAFNVALGLTYGMDKESYLEYTAIYDCISSLDFERIRSTGIQEDEALVPMTQPIVRATFTSKVDRGAPLMNGSSNATHKYPPKDRSTDPQKLHGSRRKSSRTAAGNKTASERHLAERRTSLDGGSSGSDSLPGRKAANLGGRALPGVTRKDSDSSKDQRS